MNVMNVVVLVARVFLGGVFIVAGGAKIGNAAYFAAQIAAFGILPQPVIAPMALLLPFLEVLLGGYLVIGLYARLAGWIATIQLLIFAAAIASAVARGLSLSCGCFGPNDQTVTSWPEVARDVALALVGLLVALRGPGMLALDRRIAPTT
jgi:uncharacterized membrane protein YphA (DoxX/SURF4 family)